MEPSVSSKYKDLFGGCKNIRFAREEIPKELIMTIRHSKALITFFGCFFMITYTIFLIDEPKAACCHKMCVTKFGIELRTHFGHDREIAVYDSYSSVYDPLYSERWTSDSNPVKINLKLKDPCKFDLYLFLVTI